MATLLILEDDQALANSWQHALTLADHTVFVARTATDAWNLLMAERFDLVITDLMIERDENQPSDGGMVLIGRIRTPSLSKEYAWMKRLPVLVVSASRMVGSYDPLYSAGRLGADRALRKPIDLTTLVSTVSEMLVLSQRIDSLDG